ncbi:MAG: mismatch-specific DNA-glycosylase [Nocardioides sp.]|nr:mismatch-specific DNA-glycosylase [Nocardioides sp.]
MPRFTKSELQGFYGASVPDLLPEPDQPLRLLFVGINPGLWTAATQTHFAHPVNRFYPALLRAGIIDRPIDAAAGMTPRDRDYFRARGIGISNIVHRATARASELTDKELRSGGEDLLSLVKARKPAVVAIAGITAYRTAFGLPKAKLGRQPLPLGATEAALFGTASPADDSDLWVVPNPSGLNAHETVETLAEAYAAPARAAGLL